MDEDDALLAFQSMLETPDDETESSASDVSEDSVTVQRLSTWLADMPATPTVSARELGFQDSPPQAERLKKKASTRSKSASETSDAATPNLRPALPPPARKSAESYFVDVEMPTLNIPKVQNPPITRQHSHDARQDFQAKKLSSMRSFDASARFKPDATASSSSILAPSREYTQRELFLLAEFNAFKRRIKPGDLVVILDETRPLKDSKSVLDVGRLTIVTQLNNELVVVDIVSDDSQLRRAFHRQQTSEHSTRNSGTTQKHGKRWSLPVVTRFVTLEDKILAHTGDIWLAPLEQSLDERQSQALAKLVEQENNKTHPTNQIVDKFRQGTRILQKNGEISSFELGSEDLMDLFMLRFTTECYCSLGLLPRDGSVPLIGCTLFSKPFLLRNAQKIKLYDEIAAQKAQPEPSPLDPPRSTLPAPTLNLVEIKSKLPTTAKGLPTHKAHSTRNDHVVVPTGDLEPIRKGVYRDQIGLTWYRKKAALSSYVLFVCPDKELNDNGVGRSVVKVHRNSITKSGVVPGSTWVASWYDYRDPSSSGKWAHYTCDVLPKRLPRWALKPDDYNYAFAEQHQVIPQTDRYLESEFTDGPAMSGLLSPTKPTATATTIAVEPPPDGKAFDD